MDTNGVLRKVRYILRLSDAQVADLCALVNERPDPAALHGWTRREGEPGWAPCPPALLEAFLDGLIRDRRGPPPPGASRARVPLSNNEVLKKLRIALSLREGDMLAILRAGGQSMSKAELGGLMRRPEHPNYRPCGDQAVRRFLKGLALRLRPEDTQKPSRPNPSASGSRRHDARGPRRNEARGPRRHDAADSRRPSPPARRRPIRNTGGASRVRRPVGRRRPVNLSDDGTED